LERSAFEGNLGLEFEAALATVMPAEVIEFLCGWAPPRSPVSRPDPLT
jgi:hypothetical protein